MRSKLFWAFYFDLYKCDFTGLGCFFFLFVFSILRYSERKTFNFEIIIVFHTEVLSSLRTCFIYAGNNKRGKKWVMESRMAVARRQGREKPMKIEQRKVRGPEWGPQVEQIALLASPIYTGQAWGEEKTYKKRSQRAGGLPFSSPTCVLILSLSRPLSSLHVSGSACPHASRMYFPAIF